MPHVAPFFRGISITVNCRLSQETSAEQLFDQFRNFYAECPLVQVLEGVPEIQKVANTNLTLVGGFAVDARDRTTVAVVSVIDNLRKGAASQAIQNLNLLCGFSSERGLLP